jgi:hypothetical protein
VAIEEWDEEMDKQIQRPHCGSGRPNHDLRPVENKQRQLVRFQLLPAPQAPKIAKNCSETARTSMPGRQNVEQSGSPSNCPKQAPERLVHASAVLQKHKITRPVATGKLFNQPGSNYT